jgi:hypothetical protein
MDVQAEVAQERDAVQRLAAVARRSDCTMFVDLLGWGERATDLPTLMEKPGVMFESCHRVVVFQDIDGELRYYAGGWCQDQNRIYLEQDRIWAEGSELGIFETVRDAVAFAEEYLVEERDFQAIQVPRQVHFGRSADPAKASENKTDA